MLKKIILGAILVTVIGAGGTALAYGVTTQDTEAADDVPAPLANEQAVDNAQVGQQAAQNRAGEPAVAAQEMMGEPWQAEGTITEIDDYGFQFAMQNGETVYIELGPPDYWQNQGVELQAGQAVSVDGTINEGMIHANQVALANGQILVVRSETGQPLWSGGAANGQGQNAGQADGDHTPDPQAQIDEWFTINGTLMSFQGGNMTMATTDGEIITFKTGQPRFFAEQGVTFNIGDEIVVVGFYEGAEFMAGDITQVATGLRVMLRDPNGRPLWAGPGNSNGNGGNGNGNGNSGGQGGNSHGGGNR
ncbi:MAG: hypothetical protein JXB38_20685 [Anaerolineales bacterium]|nr:hypothetical protein [Anaerolineales bacterium]